MLIKNILGVQGCLRATEVIKALIDQLALGLQKWVGWQEGDTCCLGQKKGNTAQGKSDGIGRGCPTCGYTVKSIPCECQCCSACRPGTSTGGSCSRDCTTGSSTCCKNGCICCKCTTNAEHCREKKCGCYLSAYSKTTALWTTIVNGKPGTTTTNDSTKVHLLARIFLGSVCLIWSGLSQLGFLTEKSDRWEDGTLSKEDNGLGSFMAAMGYDLERLNGSGKGECCLGWSCEQDSKQCSFG